MHFLVIIVWILTNSLIGLYIFYSLLLYRLFFSVTDLAGRIAGVTLNIDVLDSGQPPGVPLPATPLLLLIGLLGLAVSRSSRSHV